MTNSKIKSIGIAATLLTLMSVSIGANAGSIENLERERASMIEALLSGDIKNSARQRKIEISRSQLIDLERMVLRDPGLKGKNTKSAQAAFKNYDLTFLVHSSIEKGRSIADHWLGEVGLTTTSLMNARMGRR